MLDIMKSEFYKVVRSKVTLVTALCLFGMVLIQIFAFLYGKFAGGIWGEVLEGTRGIHVFAGFMLGSFFLIFIALFVGGMISNEYTNRTIRQVVSRGASRVQIALGQYIALSTAMTVIALSMAALLSIVAGLCYGFGSISPGRFLLVVVGQIVVIWSYSAITMLIAHFARSGGLSIGLNVMFLLGGETASMLLHYWTKKEYFYTYWIENMQSCALDYQLEAVKQFKFIGILFVIGGICTVLGIIRFKVRDVD
ncbi:MAG: ABC transporter permease subunit [Lachnospiraceae bacterium]|jgi:ABC-2 type transport system permease protein|nr:ABC transporter permease subunit [Lachnospiraceae bacterium]